MNFSELVFGPFVISTGALFLFLGVIASTWMLTRTVHEKKLSMRFLNDHFLIYVIVAIIMGRMGAVFHIWPTTSEKIIYSNGQWDSVLIFLRDTLSFWQGGVDFLWAIVGFFITFLFLCIYHKESILSWLDAFSLPILLLFVFLEVGGFFSGWGYGSPVDETFIFAISYDLTDVRYSGYIHPVQLYAATIFLLLFLRGLMLWSERIENEWPNGIFGEIMLFAVLISQGILEFFRGEPGTLVFNDSLPLPQLLFFSSGFLIFLFMLWKGHFHVFVRLRNFSSL